MDETPPNVGPVTDGLSMTNDIQFSPSPSSIAVAWSGIFDPESGIQDIKVTFMKRGIVKSFMNANLFVQMSIYELFA